MEYLPAHTAQAINGMPQVTGLQHPEESVRLVPNKQPIYDWSTAVEATEMRDTPEPVKVGPVEQPIGALPLKETLVVLPHEVAADWHCGDGRIVGYLQEQPS